MATAAAADTLTILHTNDIHGHLETWTGWEGDLAGQSVGGMARVAARVNEVRAQAGDGRVLLLDAGDTIGDSDVAAATQGRAVIDVMNAMRYDAMVIGNHEPDFTAASLKKRIAQADFPVLAANILQPDGSLFARPYVIREVAGVQVGILGLAYPNTPLTTADGNVSGLRFEAAIATAREYVPRMRREGADLVVALTHLGIKADQALAEAVSDIDVIVGGHSHNRLSKAMTVGRTLIVQAGAHGSDLGRLDLDIEEGRVVSHRRDLLPIGNEVVPDSAVATLIDAYRHERHAEGTVVIAHAADLIARAQTIAGQQAEPRDAESAADQVFADALRDLTGTDIALLPGLGYGVALQPGEITAAALRNLIPHDSAVWTMDLTGSQIREVLEQAVENVTTRDPDLKVGGMIQVSGLHFSYRADSPVGERVREITIGRRQSSPGQTYRVAVNGLLAQGGHNYRTFLQGGNRREVGQQYAMVTQWLTRQGQVRSPQGKRITRLDP